MNKAHAINRLPIYTNSEILLYIYVNLFGKSFIFRLNAIVMHEFFSLKLYTKENKYDFVP